MNTEQTPESQNLKAYLHEDNEELCEIVQHTISEEIEHKYAMGSSAPIMSWNTITMKVSTKPNISLGVRHAIVVPLQDKTLPVFLTNVSASGSQFLVTGQLNK